MPPRLFLMPMSYIMHLGHDSDLISRFLTEGEPKGPLTCHIWGVRENLNLARIFGLKNTIRSAMSRVCSMGDSLEIINPAGIFELRSEFAFCCKRCGFEGDLSNTSICFSECVYMFPCWFEREYHQWI